MSLRALFLTSIAVICLAPTLVLADSHRLETTPTGWWWYTNVTEAQINTIITDNGARLVDIEVLSADPLRFTAAFVHNSGVYFEPSWWHPAASGAVIDSMLAANDARLIDIEWYVTASGPRLAAVMVDNTGRDAKTWWWYVGVNDEFLADILLDNEARLVDLESFQDGGLKYAAIMVDNTGPDATGWWYYLGVPASTIGSHNAANDSRLLEYEVHDPAADTYDAILIPNDGSDAIKWWWYFDLTPEQLDAAISQNGARITDIDTYIDGSQRRYSVVMVNNSNALTTKMGHLLGYGDDGATGVYLKEVGGPILASLQPTFVHEPSSSLKVTHHLYAMRRVMLGEDSLINHLTVAEGLNGSCPTDGAPFSDQSLGQTLAGMMWDSDNTDTRAIELRYGRSAINDTSRSLVGMTSTSINRRMGCGEFPLNETTLEDMTGLYEGVAQGLYLDTNHRNLFYILMQSKSTLDPWWFTGQLEDLIHEVATDLGIPEAAADYWDNIRLAWKAGDDHFGYDTYDRYWRSISGWVSLPWYCGGMRYMNKEFVFGLFINDARSDNYCRSRYFNHTIELFREQVAAGLIACVSAVEDHTPRHARILTAAYPNPFNPQTMIEFTLDRPRQVAVAVYDAAGQRISVLTDREYAAGDHRITWNGRDGRGRQQNSGVYLIQLVSDEIVESRKITLLR